MTDLHRLLETWLVDGAVGDPPRALAVHATLCDGCAARLGAFDALAGVDVSAGGPPPPLAMPTRIAPLIAGARAGSAVAGTVLAGILVAVGASQLLGLADQGAGAEKNEPGLAGPSGPEAGVLGGEGEPATIGPNPAVAPSPSATDSASPAGTSPPGATTRPPNPPPSFSAGPTATPDSMPTPTAVPSLTPMPETPTPTPTPGPSPTPSPTPSTTPSPTPSP